MCLFKVEELEFGSLERVEVLEAGRLERMIEFDCFVSVEEFDRGSFEDGITGLGTSQV